MLENVKSFWDIALPILGGLTIGTIITFIGAIIIKAVISKLLVKIDTEKITKKAVDKGVGVLKGVHFTQSIQPIAESELMKVCEKANDIWKKRAVYFEEKWVKLAKVFATFTEYFDNSIGVSEEKKAELKNALKELLEPKDLTPETTEIVLEPETAQKTPSVNDNLSTKGVMVER